MPGPTHERIRRHVLVDFSEPPPTVSPLILDLETDFAEGLALPSHGSWGETPSRVPRNACDPGTCSCDVRSSMTGVSAAMRSPTQPATPVSAITTQYLRAF